MAYNLVRWGCAQAAMVHDKLPRQMSFTLACNVLLSQWLMPLMTQPRHHYRQEKA